MYLFDKVAGPQPRFLLKKTPAQIFFCDFCEISKNKIFIEHLRVTICDSSHHYLKIFPNIILKTTKLTQHCWHQCQIWTCICLLRQLWKPLSRITSQNLGNFQVKYRPWISVRVQSLPLRLQLILLMISKPMISWKLILILWNFICLLILVFSQFNLHIVIDLINVITQFTDSN